MNAIAVMSPFRCNAYRTLMRLAYSKADQIIANSEDTKNDLISHGVVPAHMITVIGNPVLPPVYEELAIEPIEHSWLSDGKFDTILTVGRLHRQKNQAMLIRAFANVAVTRDRLRLIILGEGEERENLLALAMRLGVCQKMDIVPFRENPYPFYKNADLFVLTSDWEGFGNVLVEAMACKTPIISTHCAGGPQTTLGVAT